MLDLSTELFTECLKRAWGPSYYIPAVSEEVPISRMNVEQSAAEQAIDLGPLNLIAGELVQIAGLNARPGLNGRVGTVVRWVPTRGRYEVQVDGEAAPLGLRPGNMTCVMDESLIEEVD